MDKGFILFVSRHCSLGYTSIVVIQSVIEWACLSVTDVICGSSEISLSLWIFFFKSISHKGAKSQKLKFISMRLFRHFSVGASFCLSQLWSAASCLPFTLLEMCPKLDWSPPVANCIRAHTATIDRMKSRPWSRELSATPPPLLPPNISVVKQRSGWKYKTISKASSAPSSTVTSIIVTLWNNQGSSKNRPSSRTEHWDLSPGGATTLWSLTHSVRTIQRRMLEGLDTNHTHKKKN